MKKGLLFIQVIFVGILGVIGMFEDAAILLEAQWDEDEIYLKYYAATLGSMGFVFAQHFARKRNEENDT